MITKTLTGQPFPGPFPFREYIPHFSLYSVFNFVTNHLVFCALYIYINVFILKKSAKKKIFPNGNKVVFKLLYFISCYRVLFPKSIGLNYQSHYLFPVIHFGWIYYIIRRRPFKKKIYFRAASFIVLTREVYRLKLKLIGRSVKDICQNNTVVRLPKVYPIDSEQNITLRLQ